MKILCLCYEFPPLGGGGSRVAHGLSRALAAAGHHVDLVTMGYRGIPAQLSVDGIQVRRVWKLRLHRSFCSAAEMVPYVVAATVQAWRSIRRNSYEINHTHFIFPDGLVAYLLKHLTGLNYIVTAHGSDVPGYNPDRFGVWHIVLRPLWRRITSEAEYIICPSLSLSRLVCRSNPNARVKIIPNGIDSSKFLPNSGKRDRILVVTRMFPRKGVQYFLKALSTTSQNHEVNIAGDGPYLNTLRQMAQDLSVRANFLDAIDNDSPELKDLYQTSRIFVLPSESENFPIVLLEAMSAGCAIITTKGTGCGEVVGDTALLVEPRDTEAIAEALAQLTSDQALCEKLGRAARERLCRDFEWQSVAEKYREVYRTVTGSNAA